MDCSQPGSSVHGIFQARVPEWVAILFSRESSDPGIEPSQITHSDIGRQVMNEFADRIKEYGTVDKAPQMEGRSMIMFISPRASD